MNILTIGIAGGTGSGKSTLVDRICARFGSDVCVLKHDELTYEERCSLNYDHSDAFETSLMIEHLRKLKAGLSVECPVYDFSQYNRTGRIVTLHPAACHARCGRTREKRPECRRPIPGDRQADA